MAQGRDPYGAETHRDVTLMALALGVVPLYDPKGTGTQMDVTLMVQGLTGM